MITPAKAGLSLKGTVNLLPRLCKEDVFWAQKSPGESRIAIIDLFSIHILTEKLFL